MGGDYIPSLRLGEQYVPPGKDRNIVVEGLAPAESEQLLRFLCEHITTDEYTCRFQWRPHSIAIWDNRSTQHKPVNDYFPAHRKLHRITVDGDRPY